MATTNYLLKTAYRDSRKDRGKLVLFMSSIVLGIAALVAINSFNYNLVQDIDDQAATLLGADIAISSNRPMNEELAAVIDSLDGEQSSQKSLFSMAYLPATDETQFVNIKALQGGFPFYGILKAEPQASSTEFRTSKTALVDEGMMLQYNLEVGDTIRLGESFFAIGGRLQSAFGSTGVGGSFAPAIYISQDYLESTELVQPGALVDYDYYYKLDKSVDADAWRKEHRRQFGDESLRIETIEGRKENLKEAFSGLNYFLNLVALVSLLLGCIGVASSVMIYVRSKMASIAVFRCLGMSGGQAFMIYFVQIAILGVIGVVIGALMGSAIQLYLPVLLKDFLPYEVDMGFSSRALIEGILIGLAVTIFFATLPLLSIRKVSPLRTLRVTEDSQSNRWDLIQWGVVSLIVISLYAFLWRMTGSWQDAIGFIIALILSFLVLTLVAKLVVWAVRRFFPTRWSYVFRQGLSNLYRPNNQTQTLLISIGLGTAVLTVLFVIQGLLLNNVSSMDAGNQPNMILYGIEKEQAEDIAKVTESFNMPVIQQVPIVTMTLDGWQGRSKKDWMRDTTRTASRWAINREARVSYRDTLTPDEILVRGEWVGEINQGDSIKISLSDGWAEAMDVDLGDELVWNVQGARIKTYVGSIREIEFKSMNTRFFVLFPKGVLEQAPQFQVLVTKSPDTKTTAKYRSSVVKSFPNVSVVDLGSILLTLSQILRKVSYVIQFMAAFSIFTGMIVLISSLLLSKYQRIKESVLLRTLGAGQRQILLISATEYALLLLTTFIGLLNSRDVINKSPLEILRKEV